MNVLHVPYRFYPDPVGGTEVYVERLAQQLQASGVTSVIATPGNEDDAYEYRGIRVRRYMVGRIPESLRDLYGNGDAGTARSFIRILALEEPHILHLHAFTRGVSVPLVRAAKAQGIPVVFTYHTPTVTCQRGTMMRWGVQACDGAMTLHTCARCTLHRLFYPSATPMGEKIDLRGGPAKALAYVLGSVPPAIGARFGRFNLEGGQWTALRMTELLQLRHATARSLLSEVDHVVAVCQWVKEVLISNGVPSHKITLCRHGMAQEEESVRPNQQLDTTTRSSLQIAFLGRLDQTKGVHILIQALRLIPQQRLRLTIYGVAQDESGLEYERCLHRLAALDKRVEFHPPVPSTQVTSMLRKYDLLAVPSQWLETGPQVVLEAFAAGVPVIGSRLGGIAELVHDGIDGILVQPSDLNDWAHKLRRLAENIGVMDALRVNIRRPRAMSSVAEEMMQVYRKLLSEQNRIG